MPLFTVPKESLDRPKPRGLAPAGRYRAGIEGVVLTPTTKGKALVVSAKDFTTLDGEQQIGEYSFAGFSRRLYINIEHPNPETVRIGFEQAARLAKALGIEFHEEADGSLSIPGADSLEELAALLNDAAGNGARVGVTLVHEPRKRNGVVQNKDDGTPIMDVNIKSIYPIDGEAA